MSVKMTDIDNKGLEAAMQGYIENQDKDHLLRLVFALKDARLFVPAMAKKGGFQPYVVKNQAGDMYMPVFTSIKKFPKDEKYQGMLKMQYKQCASMLLDNPTLVQGIALNPYTDSLMLKTQMLELARKVDTHLKEHPPKAYTVKTDDFRMVMRHNVEFHLIPKKLYEEKMDFINSLTEEELCRLYKIPFEQAGQAKIFTYTKDSFDIMELNVREDLNMMQIATPSEFLYKTNCREVYIVWNPQTGRIAYYMIEKGTDPEGKQFLLDVAKDDGTWESLEDAPAEGAVMNRVMELFAQAQEE